MRPALPLLLPIILSSLLLRAAPLRPPPLPRCAPYPSSRPPSGRAPSRLPSTRLLSMSTSYISPADKYLFDLNGYLVLRGALDGDTVASLLADNAKRGQGSAGEKYKGEMANGLIPASVNSRPRMKNDQDALHWGKAYRDIMAHPQVCDIVEQMCGPNFRLDHVNVRYCTVHIVHYFRSTAPHFLVRYRSTPALRPSKAASSTVARRPVAAMVSSSSTTREVSRTASSRSPTSSRTPTAMAAASAAFLAPTRAT